MRIETNKVIIKKRVRGELREIPALMESMRSYGQLTPIILNRKNELIAGNRRLEAAKRLGWNSIDAIVIDKDDDIEMLELELEENIQRNDLTGDEISIGFSRLEKLRNPGFFRRIINFFKRLFRRIFGGKR
jgi:ParB family transcriptional regulator, chromosome partitioning protein